MKISDLIDNFVDDLEFNKLIELADILKVDHAEEYWFDDEWDEKEGDLRVSVAEAMKEDKV